MMLGERPASDQHDDEIRHPNRPQLDDELQPEERHIKIGPVPQVRPPWTGDEIERALRGRVRAAREKRG